MFNLIFQLKSLSTFPEGRRSHADRGCSSPPEAPPWKEHKAASAFSYPGSESWYYYMQNRQTNKKNPRQNKRRCRNHLRGWWSPSSFVVWECFFSKLVVTKPICGKSSISAVFAVDWYPPLLPSFPWVHCTIVCFLGLNLNSSDPFKPLG